MNRTFLLFEALAFASASLIHSGVLLHGYEHERAATAERIIALILFAGLALTWIPRAERAVAITAQALALFGTLLGIFTIVIGVGPRTVPDIVYHIGIVALLVCGLIVPTYAADSTEVTGVRN